MLPHKTCFYLLLLLSLTACLAPRQEAEFCLVDSDCNGSSVCVNSECLPEILADCPDEDRDGVCNDFDICPGGDDAEDLDGDANPDGCDPCPFDYPNDSDDDGVCNSYDVCEGGDDTVDLDEDGVPDACDSCEDHADEEDRDQDGAPDGCDLCR